MMSNRREANPYTSRPWTRQYRAVPADAPASVRPVPLDFQHIARESPAAPALIYFDAMYSYEWLNTRSDALAAWLARECQIAKNDRIAIILQNVPDFAVVMLASWKLGAVPLPLNPMYKREELGKLFADSRPRVMICHRGADEVIRAGMAWAGLPSDAVVLTVCPRAHQQRNDNRVFLAPSHESSSPDLSRVIESNLGARAPVMAVSLQDDLALLLYTSGTTGTPKGAEISHGALAFNALASSRWFGLVRGGKTAALAPLFHITGFALQLCASLINECALILTYRFEPQVVLEAFLEHRPSFGIGAITAYIALANQANASAAHFSSFDCLVCGGAPIAPSVLDRFANRFEKRIRSGFGMTETAGASHLSPHDRMPVHAESGALSVGVPLPGVDAEIRLDDDSPAPVGHAGELVVRGPLLMSGYRNNPTATAEALGGGWLRTGDVALMDTDGWFYIVDRKKDVIIASGFKVWPREVEDVLYQFPGVREAAVVGVADDYRGETVIACVSLAAGATVHADDLIAHCRERLAAFKVPRRVAFLPELPKTVTGKIMRSELRRQMRDHQ
jgi:long-chain acyl-CoA synthetase